MTTVFAIAVFDFEARGDIAHEVPMSIWGVETLASVGAASFILTIDAAEMARVVEAPSRDTALDVTLPTPYSDEHWRTMPLSASTFFEAHHPQLLSQLRERGHVHVPDRDHYMATVRAAARRVQQWLDALTARARAISPDARLLVAYDTAMSDNARLTSLLATIGQYGPPYSPEGRYNGRRILLYDQVGASLRMHGQDIWDAYQRRLQRIAAARTHVADEDALAMAHECLLTLAALVAATPAEIDNAAVDIPDATFPAPALRDLLSHV